jgi:hypothetical protein
MGTFMRTTLTIHHHNDEEVVVNRKAKYNPKIPRFKRLGMDLSTDILDLLAEKYYSNPSVNWFLWKLIKLINTRTNTTILLNSSLTSSEVRRVVAAYKVLEQDNIVIRTKREHYIINPMVFLPNNETFDEVLEHWLSIGGK